jgi:hypothetical protein
MAKVEEYPVSSRDVLTVIDAQGKVFNMLYSCREPGELMLVPFNVESGAYEKPLLQQPVKDSITKAVQSGQFFIYACENLHKSRADQKLRHQDHQPGDHGRDAGHPQRPLEVDHGPVPAVRPQRPCQHCALLDLP